MGTDMGRCFFLVIFAALLGAAEPLRICASVPELGLIAQAVGGEQVTVTVFAKPGDDPHHVDPRPSFVVVLARADFLIETGLEQEVGWLPPLVLQARNARLAMGQPGRLVAADAVEILERPTGPIDRSQGDVHPGGNPHFLLDPVNAVLVGDRVAARLSALRPAAAATFAAAAQALRNAIGEALAGPVLHARFDGVKLGILAGRQGLVGFLREQGAATDLGGWLARLGPQAGRRVVVDHNLWPYVAQRFGLVTVGALEPLPGVAPSSRHLASVVAIIREQQVGALLVSPFFDRRVVDVVVAASGVHVAAMAHQPGSMPGTGTLLEWYGHNVDELVRALAP